MTSSEWPESVQDTSHSIQDVEQDPYFAGNEERIPLIHDRDSSCVRNMWIITFFALFCIGFTTGAYLLLTEVAEWSEPDEYRLIARDDWQANEASSEMPRLKVPVENVVLTKTDSPGCDEQKQCSTLVHDVQNGPQANPKGPDIIYNFLVAGNGQIYEGRGWNYQSQFSSTRNGSSTVVIAFLGLFSDSLPSQEQLNQTRNFIEASKSEGKITPCCIVFEEELVRSRQNVTQHLKQFLKEIRNGC